MRVWGILLLVGAGTMFGFYKAYGYRKRITDIINAGKMRFACWKQKYFIR